jgi:transposase
MQRIEAREGQPMEVLLRSLYVEQGLLLAEVGARLGVGESAVSRWLAHFGIEARRGGPQPVAEAVA